MELRVKEFLKQFNIDLSDKTVIVGVSGGVDSVALLHILYNLGVRVVLAHVNHNARVESKMEEIEMKKLAESLNIPFHLLDFHFSGSGNFHDESHVKKLEFFKELADKYNTNYIAMAHQSDEQIETVLMKIMEGSNLYGYGGISIDQFDGKYHIIRPLLCLKKSEIYDYVKKNKYIYFEDKTNFLDDYLRNRLRHNVIPYLKNEAPSLNEKIEEYSVQLKEAFSFIRDNSKEYLKENNNEINLNTFKSLNIAVKKDIISFILENNKIRKNYDVINSILNLLSSSDGYKSIDLENGYSFVRSYDKAYLKKYDEIEINECLVDLKSTLIYLNKYKIYFSKKIPSSNAKYIKLCYNNIKLPFHVRSVKEGDLIELPSCNKKVSRLFIDEKIPKDERKYIPIILDDLGNIIWVYDLRKSNKIFEYKNNSDIYLIVEE